MPLGAFRLNTLSAAMSASSGRSALTFTAVGNATTSSTQVKFGAESGFFDGTGDYLTCPTDCSQSGDFTIEMWLYPTNLTGFHDFFCLGTSNVSPRRSIATNGAIVQLFPYNTGASLSANTSLTINTWNHFALVRSSGTVRMFINGTLQTATLSDTGTFGAPGVMIGTWAGETSYFAGYIDEVRMSNTARYSATFTPATAEFQNDANTIFLLHCNGAGSNIFIDDIGGGLITATVTNGSIAYYLANSVLYKTYTFSTAGSASWNVSSVTGTPVIDAIIWAGGGGGGGVNGNRYGSGGGGGGQVIQLSNRSTTAQTYSFTIGAAGTAGSITYGTRGGNGGSTIAFGSTLLGGGGGANGTTGASGAYTGGGGSDNSGSGNAGGTGSAYNGGASAPGSGSGTGAAAGGGGGGAAGNGTAGVAATKKGGDGGAGITSSINGLSLTFGFGGGGSGETTAGTPNGRTTSGAGTGGQRGNGGGGAMSTAALASTGGAGGIGGVIIRHPVDKVTSISYVTSVTSSSGSTITWPTVQAGDLALYYNVAINSTTTIPGSNAAPTGFTTFGSPTSGSTLGTRSNSGYKICVGNEGGTTITTTTGTLAKYTTLVIYRGNIPISVVTNAVAFGQTTDVAPSSQTLTMSSATGPYVAVASYTSSGTVSARGSTVTETREISNGTNQYVKTFEATSSAVSFANSTISMADYGTNVLVSHIIQVY